jgi:hypothetical protein
MWIILVHGTIFFHIVFDCVGVLQLEKMRSNLLNTQPLSARGYIYIHFFTFLYIFMIDYTQHASIIFLFSKVDFRQVF